MNAAERTAKLESIYAEIADAVRRNARKDAYRAAHKLREAMAIKPELPPRKPRIVEQTSCSVLGECRHSMLDGCGTHTLVDRVFNDC